MIKKTFVIFLLFYCTNVISQNLIYFKNIDKDELSSKESLEKLNSILKYLKCGNYRISKKYKINKRKLKKVILGYWRKGPWSMVVFKKSGIFKVYNRYHNKGNSPLYSGYYKFEDNTVLFKVFGSKIKGWQRCPIKEVIFKKHKSGIYNLTIYFKKVKLRTDSLTGTILNGVIFISFK